MSVLQQGVIIIDSAYDEETDVCGTQAIPAKYDYAPGTIIFIQALVGSIWWILNMFVYSANANGLKGTTGADTLPVAWMWNMFGNSRYGYTAAMYFSVFLLQAFVSVIEVIAWVFYMFGKNWWLGWWVAYPGWFAAVYGLVLPWVFPILQLVLPTDEGGLEGVNTNEFGNNSIFMILMNMIMWISGAAAHAIMAPRLGCHIAA